MQQSFKTKYYKYLFMLGFVLYGLNILGSNQLCGIQPTIGAQLTAKKCSCLGNVTTIQEGTLKTQYCTGLNFSINRLNSGFNNFFTNNVNDMIEGVEIDSTSDNIRSVRAKQNYTLTVRVTQIGTGEAVSNITLGIYDQANKLIGQGNPDTEGTLSILIPEGNYIVRPTAGYSGKQVVALNADKSIELFVMRVER